MCWPMGFSWVVGFQRNCVGGIVNGCDGGEGLGCCGLLWFFLALPFKGRVGWGWCSYSCALAREIPISHPGESLSFRHSGDSRIPFVFSFDFRR